MTDSKEISQLRRQILLGAAGASLAGYNLPTWAQGASQTLKISHQFPSGTDFRDRLCKKFADEVSKRTNGALKFDVYPQHSLMKTMAQFSAMRKGALDLSLYPLPYAGTEVPEANIGLMPGLVTSYEQGAKWKNAEVGKLLNKVMASKGIVIVSWIWQAGGVATRSGPIILPDDIKGVKVRGGSRAFDLMLKTAGGSVMTSIGSDETYQAMQSGSLDAVYTSSASLMSFKIQELSKNFTSAKNKSYWFMMEPLMMSKSIFDALPKNQQDIIMAVGSDMEKYGTEQAKLDDINAAIYFAKGQNKIFELDSNQVDKWRTVAKASAWLDFANQNETCAAMIKSAEKIS
ncbi:C4-dicarboxylate ABC transporter [Polynucleobacter paneuropaeus]|uniref:TRAP transporter substrate-binding protein DctP n=1 Tax=Polynucleobacter paneuropaeus TaxID=2527775 RepID=UPI000DBF05F1|nr:TRAP transporter substrate-binding protein DctP [Polynucleobacter paneuropaeus]AWW45752.1 C4-dicarboxylate ABC transporter [Polynucleobacter paneuropaeus]QWC95639.1 C4-dicarboxylate ABC transporter [Polynucleobacter paneuropaeus]